MYKLTFDSAQIYMRRRAGEITMSVEGDLMSFHDKIMKWGVQLALHRSSGQRLDLLTCDKIELKGNGVL